MQYGNKNSREIKSRSRVWVVPTCMTQKIQVTGLLDAHLEFEIIVLLVLHWHKYEETKPPLKSLLVLLIFLNLSSFTCWRLYGWIVWYKHCGLQNCNWTKAKRHVRMLTGNLIHTSTAFEIFFFLPWKGEQAESTDSENLITIQFQTFLRAFFKHYYAFFPHSNLRIALKKILNTI